MRCISTSRDTSTSRGFVSPGVLSDQSSLYFITKALVVIEQTGPATATGNESRRTRHPCFCLPWRMPAHVRAQR